MPASPQQLRFRNRVPHGVLFGFALALVGLFTVAAPGQANAQAVFAASKNICLGDPSTNAPNTCPYAPIVGVGQPVFYVIKVTNPFGSPPEQITLTEHYPVGFVPGAIVCKDQTGATITVAVTGSTIGAFNLPLDTTVTCTIAGYFNSSASGLQPTNTVDVKNDNTTQSVSVATSVASTTPLNADLSVTKSVSPSPIGAGTAYPLPATVTYTVKITNNSSNAVDVGHWFVLHDTLALLPNSDPLYATVVANSFTCSVTTTSPATDCLDTAAMNGLTWTQQLIGTMAPHSMFDWKFPSSPTPGYTGHIGAGATITLTWQVKIEKLPTLSCVRSLTSNGLENQAFFTLTNPDGTAVSDINNANNTAPAPLTVNLAGTVNPNCGDDQLTMTKTQVSPVPVTNPVAWGLPPWAPSTGTVTYDIKITNTSMPAQTIVIPGNKLWDFVVDGVGTPPFTSTFVGATCLASNQPGLCNAFNAGGGGLPSPPAPFPSPATWFKYTYYGQPSPGWHSKLTKPLVLPYLKSVTIRIAFNYYGPDCDTVPNVYPKPVDNEAQIAYTATAIGVASGSPQNVQYTQTAHATTNMRPQHACRFVVTKRFRKFSPTTVQFSGPPLVYDVAFTNNDASRNIGTVMDAVRITDPLYATQVPFAASWNCSTSTGVSGFTPSGSFTSGQAIYTTAPSQGAPVMQQPPTIYFPTGSTLKCTITIYVTRPAFDNPHCSTAPAYFENAALMDVTHPYNSNVPWAPSGFYNTTAISNPALQNKNWATLKAPLPKCYDAIIQKSAWANGHQPAWTWAGMGGQSVNYAISVTNTGTTGTLTGSGTTEPSWNGLGVTDTVTSYPFNMVSAGWPLPPVCPSGWCRPFQPLPTSPSPSPSYAGVLSLGAGLSGTWNLTLHGSFQAGTNIRNCAGVAPVGSFAGPGWYPNYNPNSPPPNAQHPLCVIVPVLDTRTLSVTKTVVNQTGAPIAIPPLAFNVQAACGQSAGQWWVPTASRTLTTPAVSLANGASTSSFPGQVQHVPITDQCVVTETLPLPPVPVGAKKACSAHGAVGVAYWDTTVTPTQPITITAAGPNAVTVTNTLRCKISAASLTVTKKFVDATGTSALIGPLSFHVQTTTCTPTALPSTSLPLTTPATTTTSNSSPATVPNVPVADTCGLTEILPAIPSAALRACGGAAYWDNPIYAGSNVTPTTNGANVAMNTGGASVTVTNTLHCKKSAASLTVTKKFVDATGSSASIGPLTFNVQTTCTPVALPPTNLSLTTPATATTSSSAPANIANVPVNDHCTLTETLPQMPAAALRYCMSNGQRIASWDTTFAPALPVTVTAAGPNAITVTNTLSCKKAQTGTLTILKTLTMGPTQQPDGPFKFNVVCTNPAYSTSVTIPYTWNGNATSNPSLPVTVPNIPLGATCTVTEVTPVPAVIPPGEPSCWYYNPSYTPSGGLQIQAPPATNIVTVHNAFACLPHAPVRVPPAEPTQGHVTIKKTVAAGVWSPGSAGVFHLVVTNNGTALAPPTTVAVNDNLPSGLNFVAATGRGWACGSSARVTCTYSGAVAAGQSLPPISVTAIAGKPGRVKNCATVALNGARNSVPGNNMSCIGVRIVKARPADDNSVTPFVGPSQNGGEVEPTNPGGGGSLPTVTPGPTEPPPLLPPPLPPRHRTSPGGKGNEGNAGAAPHP